MHLILDRQCEAGPPLNTLDTSCVLARFLHRPFTQQPRKLTCQRKLPLLHRRACRFLRHDALTRFAAAHLLTTDMLTQCVQFH
jgi:hypothetical protein